MAIFLTLIALVLIPSGVFGSSLQDHSIDSLALDLARQLNEHLALNQGPPPKTLVVSLVDMNQLHCTSKFGQAIPERLRVFLQHMGWKIIEARRGLTVKLQKDVGQFNLSDEVTDLASRVRCNAILAGTYLFHMGKILVNVRLISLPDNEIISSAAASVPADPKLSTLLKPVGYGCKAPKAFLKVVPWGEGQEDDEDSQFLTQ